jgi:inorganic pyrophosphatase
MIEVFIEVEAGSRERRRYDEKTLEYLGSRQAPRPYPYAYGFVIGTQGEDGEALDCYLITQRALKAGDRLACEPAGLLEVDEDGERDDKLLATLPGEPPFAAEPVLATLREFIAAIFAKWPEMQVRVGAILPRQAALDYLDQNWLSG